MAWGAYGELRGQPRRRRRVIAGTAAAAVVVALALLANGAYAVQRDRRAIPPVSTGTSVPGVGAAPGAPAASSVPVRRAAPAPAERPCQDADLSVRHVGEGYGATGHLIDPYLVENRSSTACSIEGFPELSFVRADGRADQTAVSRRSAFWDPVPVRVELRPGAAARFATDRETCGGPPDTPQIERTMIVVLPGLREARRAGAFSTCAWPDAAAAERLHLAVSPLQSVPTPAG